ncbi:MAG: mycothiol system anti-sigma-R factor [Acidimicrobiaceae bacterium]|nr:mycothiol system anti-sigma-R factor [Acidimicrobiaceae bacterium]
MDHDEKADEGSHSQCEEALDTLYHYLDGELTSERRQQIQRHLEGCSPCLEAFDFEAELKEIIARRCKDQVPESLRVRVAQALAEASVTVHRIE